MIAEAMGTGGVPPLAVLVDFLNTFDERSFSVDGARHAGRDEVSTSAELSSWLAGRGLIHAGTPASDADVREAHALRSALRGALAARVDPGWDWLTPANDTMAGLSLRVALGADGTPRLSPAAGGAVPAALSRLAASSAVSAAEGSWQRLKMCAASDCRWVFHDTSRNGLGRWCSMRICGNREKTRAYRLRQGSSLPSSGRK